MPRKNIINIPTLKRMLSLCQQFAEAVVFKAVILTAFFGFFRLSNIAPHAVAEFDCTRHFTGADVFFQKNEVKLLLKWSKTFQSRDQYKLVALPRLFPSPLCPYKALKDLFSLYTPGANNPLFQIRSASGWQVLTDSRVRKTLWGCQAITTPSMLSGAQVPHWLMMLISLLKKLRNMAPGRLIAFGGIFSPVKLLGSKCRKNSESCCRVGDDASTSTWFLGFGQLL